MAATQRAPTEQFHAQSDFELPRIVSRLPKFRYASTFGQGFFYVFGQLFRVRSKNPRRYVRLTVMNVPDTSLMRGLFGSVRP